MMGARLILVVVLAVAAFLVCAKAHGRQVRSERERAGIHHVVFGGTNPAFVEALWRRDRLRFWPTAAVVALAVVALAVARGAPPLAGAVPFAAWAGMVVAFLLASVLSAGSFARMSEPIAADALRAHWVASGLYWATAVALVIATVVVAWPALRGPAVTP